MTVNDAAPPHPATPNMEMAAQKPSGAIVEDSRHPGSRPPHSLIPTSFSSFVSCYLLPLVEESHVVLPDPLRAFLPLTFTQVIGPA